ncbi:MAG TPA: PIN domain-containing protein [Candidatus Angelobacter sp.]|nr:PIN domain-containing protein [Candidatus Angelobacter sp.]
MKVLFDANVVLDVYLDRAPWASDSKAAFQLALDGKIEGYLSAISFTTIYYLLRKQVGSALALNYVIKALTLFRVAEVDYLVLSAAARVAGSDFEDHVQASSAELASLDAIVTRDPAGFREATLRVLAPGELAALVK